MIKLNFTILLLFLLVSQLAFSQTTYRKLEKSQTDPARIELATKIVDAYFKALKSGESYDFKDQAVKEFKDEMTPEAQKQTYDQIKKMFGRFESLTYSGTWVNETNNKYDIVRFKGNFKKSKEPLEIRLVLNKSNKVAGLWIRPWKDNLNDS